MSTVKAALSVWIEMVIVQLRRSDTVLQLNNIMGLIRACIHKYNYTDVSLVCTINVSCIPLASVGVSLHISFLSVGGCICG